MPNIPLEAQELIAKFEQQEAALAVSRPVNAKEKPDKPESRNVRDILSAAANSGCDLRKGKGDHRVIIRTDGATMPIPVGKKELGKGLAHKIWGFIRLGEK